MKKWRLYIFNVVCLILTSVVWQLNAFGAASINFSKFRFVFDDNLRQDSLVLSNLGSNAVSCTLSAENFLMSEDGPLKLATEEDRITNSAESIVRFSPRKVTINAANKQTVRIASRRRPNIEDGEYLSYLKMSCIEQAEPNQQQSEQISINANFIHYIPMSVRVGKLKARTRIDNAKLSSVNGQLSLSFDNIREGNRSVIGDIDIIEKNSGNVLGQIVNTVIYVPFTKKQHQIKLTGRPNGLIEIIFTEDKLSRGELVTKTEVET